MAEGGIRVQTVRLGGKDQDQAGSEQMDVADKGLERGWFRFHLLWWRVGHHGCVPRAQEA